MHAATRQHTPPTREARRAGTRRDHSAASAKRQLQATAAVMRLARTDRQLVHPIGGLEGYSPTEVRFAQMRTREASRPRAVAHYLSIHG